MFEQSRYWTSIPDPLRAVVNNGVKFLLLGESTRIYSTTIRILCLLAELDIPLILELFLMLKSKAHQTSFRSPQSTSMIRTRTQNSGGQYPQLENTLRKTFFRPRPTSSSSQPTELGFTVLVTWKSGVLGHPSEIRMEDGLDI
jgi:hypothetical protein